MGKKCVVYTNNTQICFYNVVGYLRSSHYIEPNNQLEPYYQHKSVLCLSIMETWNHLFFSCQYSAQVWSSLMSGLLKDDYSTDWNVTTTLIKDPNYNQDKLFIIRYVFQAYPLPNCICLRSMNLRLGKETDCRGVGKVARQSFKETNFSHDV